jgi:hypothetical protein
LLGLVADYVRQRVFSEYVRAQRAASCPPRQGDNVPARFKHVETIGETLNILDALSEIGGLVVCARGRVAGRVS